MNILLRYIFLFWIGCTVGWGMEVLFRRFKKSNTSRKWINPGFLTGPYLPLYGFGLCILYLLSRFAELSPFDSALLTHIYIVALMTVSMTVLELVTGLIFIKTTNVRLWDYSEEWANYKGIICPKFSIIWGVLGSAYYFFIDRYICNAVIWFYNNLAFAFILGVFFGIFAIDFAYNTDLIFKIKKLAEEHEIQVRYDELKQQIALLNEDLHKKIHFFRAFKSPISLSELIKKYKTRYKK